MQFKRLVNQPHGSPNRNRTETRLIPDDFGGRRAETGAMDWPNEQADEIAVAETPTALGALRAVLAAAERLGIGRSQLLAVAEAEADQLDAADRATLALLKPVTAPPCDVFLARVRSSMATLLADGRLSVEEMARELAVSARTLQRRLEQAGTTFGEVCDDTRRAAALAHLRNPEVPIKEAAFRLGFSEPSTFYRAFRRWTGDTPANYRRAVAT